MGLLKKGINTLSKKHHIKSEVEFEKYNNLLVLGRIRIISLATIFMGIIFYSFDYITAKNGVDKMYITTIVILHTVCILFSLIYLFVHSKITKNNNYNKLISLVPVIYTFLYVLMGVLSSINSQRHTGNIYSFVCLSIVAAVGFTLKPCFMLIIYGVNYIIFIKGIESASQSFDLLMVKQLNATTMTGIAILFSYFFYKLRLNDYITNMKLIESEENFRKLFYVNPFPVFITRIKDGKIIKASEQALKIMGITEEDLDKFDYFGMQIKEDSRIALIEEVGKKQSIYNRIVEYEINGKSMWVTANYELINYSGEECIITGFMDITEIRKVEEELSEYAFIDVLTGVLNRRMGIRKVEELTQKAKNLGLEFILCFFDMNDLKSVNDTYGHGQGDNYIRAFCSTVIEEISLEDIFFRMGGDEFIIVFTQSTLVEAEDIWERIISRFYQISREMNISIKRAASHGFYHYKAGIDITLEEMIEKADKHMYEEKQIHKNINTN
ncbi:MAG: diguanylate cyclase/phosphodiesterase with sensor [Anaerocolumna sp.]|jgi:diguanylate cyclase (GGDEF)-like protein/PAS domain S-box-containing protein|nr:diguanylate cyclase/phosphodiesterase with sensor [Anaerocolumna sp.]